MSLKYSNVMEAFYNTPWALRPETFMTIKDLLLFKAQGGELTDDEIQARIGAAPVRPGAAHGTAIAVLPLYGVVAQRMNLMMATSGGTSIEVFGRTFRQAVADQAIGAIVIDVDSPGGSVFGVPEMAQDIYAARDIKPVVAVANSQAASAAYWLGASASELVVTPGGEVGSIGVLAAHEDISEMQSKAGVTTTLVSAGKYKVEGSPYGPLTDEAREAIQSRVNEYYEMFLASVARGRGVSVAEVRGGFGQGRMVGSRRALQLGMVDRIATLNATIARLSGSVSRGSPSANNELVFWSHDAREWTVAVSNGTDVDDTDPDSGLLVEPAVEEMAVEDLGGDRDWRERRLRLNG